MIKIADRHRSVHLIEAHLPKLRSALKACMVQVAAVNRLPSVKRPPEEIKNQDSPDICLVKTVSEARPIMHCSECKSRYLQYKFASYKTAVVGSCYVCTKSGGRQPCFELLWL